MANLVLVTDATSFVSSHIIKHLQDEGYQVRGTVSSLTEEEERVKLVHEMSPDAKFKVEVVEADPASSDAWESAMKDVQFVIHSVKAQAAVPSETEGEAPAQPAVDAVLNVFKASVAAKSVKRVVLTSSYQAICSSPTVATDKVYTEADWAEVDSAEPLVKSVILAEKAAWDFVKELTDADKIELCVMNPTMPLGPPLIDAQQDVVRLLLDRGVGFCPKVCYSVVDVRDVAAAHAKAISLDNVVGNRHILHGSNLWIKDAANHLSDVLKPQGFKIPTLNLPNWSLSLYGLINKNVKTLQPMVGKQMQFDNSKMKEALELTPREVKDTVVDEANALIERGLIKMPKLKKVKAEKEGAAAAAEGAEAKPVEEGEEKAAEEAKENGDVKEAAEGEEKAKEEEKPEAEAASPPAAEAKSEEAEKKEETPAAASEEEKKDGSGDATATPAEETKAEN